jgi:broad specificity phosphatase PhoE
MTSLLIVRHGPPAIDPDAAASSWELSTEGEVAVRSLGRRLDTTGRSVVSSSEPKAVRTAELLNPAVHTIDIRLNEVERPPGWVDDYPDRAARYLAGQPVHGWEPVELVRTRMHDAVCELADGTVVVGHGLALSILVGAVAGLNPVGFWRSLWMPDAWILADGEIRRAG